MPSANLTESKHPLASFQHQRERRAPLQHLRAHVIPAAGQPTVSTGCAGNQWQTLSVTTVAANGKKDQSVCSFAALTYRRRDLGGKALSLPSPSSRFIQIYSRVIVTGNTTIIKHILFRFLPSLWLQLQGWTVGNRWCSVSSSLFRSSYRCTSRAPRRLPPPRTSPQPRTSAPFLHRGTRFSQGAWGSSWRPALPLCGRPPYLLLLLRCSCDDARTLRRARNYRGSWDSSRDSTRSLSGSAALGTGQL